MKAKTLTALTLSSLLLLSGCSNKTVNGKSVAASTTIKNITADRLYKELSNGSNGSSALFNYVLDKLIDKKFPATNDMKSNAEDMYSSVLSSYTSQYSSEDEALEKLESDLKSAGYTSIEDYKSKVVYSMQYAEMMKKYVKANYDEVYNDYYSVATPRKVSIIAISAADASSPTDEEQANLKEVQDLLAQGQSFATVAKKYSSDTSTKDANGSLGIVDSTNSLSSTYTQDVATQALSLKEGETSEVITGSTAFYILHCDSTNKKTIKSELKNVDINSPLLTYDNYLVYKVFNTYKINYQDKTIKKMVTNYVKEQLQKRSDERKTS